jgi:hypothetical protein
MDPVSPVQISALPASTERARFVSLDTIPAQVTHPFASRTVFYLALPARIIVPLFVFPVLVAPYYRATLVFRIFLAI